MFSGGKDVHLQQEKPIQDLPRHSLEFLDIIYSYSHYSIYIDLM